MDPNFLAIFLLGSHFYALPNSVFTRPAASPRSAIHDNDNDAGGGFRVSEPERFAPFFATAKFQGRN